MSLFGVDGYIATVVEEGLGKGDQIRRPDGSLAASRNAPVSVLTLALK